MDSHDLFLSCYNMTLGQYRALTLARALTGAAGCIVSLTVLGIIVLTARRKAWENISKRLYFAAIFYVLFYSIMAIAAVNYSHPPSQQSRWCEAVAYLLHYSGTLVVAHYLACAIAVMLQVTVPVYQAVRKGNDRMCISPRKAKLTEALLFLILFLSPLLNTWEPFLPQFAPYGNYGPLCWFRLELTDNCTTNTTHKSDINALYLQTVPFAIVAFVGSVLTSMTLVALCGMYCKFRMRTTGTRISRVIPPMAILIFVIFLFGVYFTIISVNYRNVNSFSAWLSNVTVTLAVSVGLLVIVGVYVHFPMKLCLYPKNSPSTQPSLQNPTIRTSRASQTVPSQTVAYLAHETVTTTEASPLIVQLK